MPTLERAPALFWRQHTPVSLDFQLLLTLTSTLFLHLSYGDSDGYEKFGWWDLQGDGTHADEEDAGAEVEIFEEDRDWDGGIADCLSLLELA